MAPPKTNKNKIEKREAPSLHGPTPWLRGIKAKSSQIPDMFLSSPHPSPSQLHTTPLKEKVNLPFLKLFNKRKRKKPHPCHAHPL
jgi:hypothetical protein